MNEFEQKCVEYLNNLIHNADNIPFEKRINQQYLRRNILFYSWIIQRRYMAVQRNTIVNLTSPKLPDVVNFVIDVDFADFVDESNNDVFTLKREMLNAIETVFDAPELGYQILSDVPYFETGVSGIKLVEYVNQLGPTDRNLTDLISNGLRIALGNIKTEIIDDDLSNIRLIHGPEEAWRFLLAVYPMKTALTLDETYKIMADVAAIRTVLSHSGIENDLNVLFVAPTVHDDKVIPFLEKRFPRTFHLWSLSLIRFFHLLVDNINTSKESTAENFIAIFEGQKASFSSVKATQNIKKKLK
jgi:hypothetical protein